MLKKIFFVLTAPLIGWILATHAGAEVVVDNNLNMDIPCINASGSYYQCKLLRYINPGDPDGFYWQFTGNLTPTIDNGDCASVDGNLLITIPTLDAMGTKYSVTLTYYPNVHDPHGFYWNLGELTPKAAPGFSLSSQNFSNNGIIPLVHACTSVGGANTSPQLSWSNSVQGTMSFALIMDDEDSPCGIGVNACKHWSVFNIPASVTHFQTNQDIGLISGATQGKNWEGSIGYAGPCPPNQHTYTLAIYALAAGMPILNTGEEMTRSKFENDYAAFILGISTLKGIFTP